MHYPFLLGAARVLSGVSPNRFVLSQANRTAPNQKPRLAEVLSLTSDSLPMLLLLLRISATPNSSLVLVQLALYRNL